MRVRREPRGGTSPRSFRYCYNHYWKDTLPIQRLASFILLLVVIVILLGSIAISKLSSERAKLHKQQLQQHQQQQQQQKQQENQHEQDHVQAPEEMTKMATNDNHNNYNYNGSNPDKYYTPPRVVYNVVIDNNGVNSSLIHGTDRFIRYEATEECKDGSTEPLTVKRWAYLLSSENADPNSQQELALNLTNIMRNAPYTAFFFETKGVNSGNADNKHFEFVLVDGPNLADFADGNPDPETFSDHMGCLPETAPGCQFTNLDGTSTLVAPRQQSLIDSHQSEDNSGSNDKNSVGTAVYAHLASFLRGAPSAQIAGLWKIVASTYFKMLSSTNNNSVWLSTEGSGVAWLHFRFDPRPKYYHYSPFAKES